jgi:flagellin
MSIGINSNINSLIAQENLNTSQSALSQAITRLSSGKRINSAADDAAGLAISNTLQTQINGLNQGVSNANDGVSLIQTASSGLSQITTALQTIRTLAVQASSGSLSSSNQAALQQEVAQQIAEVNRVASQTQYNGKNLLDGSAGNVVFQVGANVGQTIGLNLTQSLSSASLGGGTVAAGATLGTISGLNLAITGGVATEAAPGSTGAITAINILSDGNGGFTFTDQNDQTIPSTALINNPAVPGTDLFTNTGGTLTLNTAATANPLTAAGALTDITAAGLPTALNAGQTLGVISNIAIDPTTGADVAAGSAGFASAITSITVKSNGAAGYTLDDQNGNQLSTAAVTAIFGAGANTNAGAPLTFAATDNGGAGPATTLGTATVAGGALASVNSNNTPPLVSSIDVSTTTGANQAIEAIDNALSTINNIQASIGAAQNRFTSIASAQQSQSTDLSGAESQITDADFAQETANLSKAQVLQQAGISVLAQANSNPQQVLKLLQ